jgi:predicted Zn-dependent protease
LSAFVGTYQGSLQNVGRVVLRAAHIRQDRNVYLLAGIAQPDTYSGVEEQFMRAIESFRALSRAEAEALRPNRVTLYTAQTGDSWQSIAERESRSFVKASTLAIMNGHDVGDQPRAGERLKIVVAG